MKVFEIIDALCNHEMSKHEACTEINTIINGLRKNDALEFDVESVGFSVENNHGFLNLKLPYGYRKFEGKIDKGDKVDVSILP